MSLEHVYFKDQTPSPKQRVREGIPIGALAVVPEWKIYVVEYGIPIMPVKFRTANDAVAIAKWIDTVYKNYYTVLDWWRQADFFFVTRYSVPDGINIYETFATLPRIATFSDVEACYKIAQHSTKSIFGDSLI